MGDEPESMLVTPHRVESASTYVALSADHLIAVEFGGESLERWLNDTTTKTEDKVKSRFLKVGMSAECIKHIPII